MRLEKRILPIIIIAIGIYAIFLMLSDFSKILNKITEFKIEFLPFIILLVPCGWISLYFRWYLLLKNLNVKLPHRKNFEIYMAGFPLGITPGKLGELIKSQILKEKFDTPRKITLPLILIERLYNVIGIVIVSLLGVLYFQFSLYVLVITIILLLITFFVISNKSLFTKLITWTSKKKFFVKYTQSLFDSYDIIRKSTRGMISIYAAILSVLYWFFESLAVYFVLLAFGINNLNFLAVVTTYTTAIILGVMSFLPAGIGVAEGSLVGLLSIQGLEISTTLVLVILIRFFTLWYAVIVGLVTMKLINH